MMNVTYPIIDADGHVLEKDRELHDYLGGRYSSAPRFETYGYFPSLDGWNRGTGVPGKDPETSRAALARISRRARRLHDSSLPDGRFSLGTRAKSRVCLRIGRRVQFVGRRPLYEAKPPTPGRGIITGPRTFGSRQGTRAGEVNGTGRWSIACCYLAQ